MLTTSKNIVKKAYEGGYAIPAINTQGGNYDIIMAICKAAETKKSPIILAHYEITGQYSGHDWFAEVARWCASKVSIPVAIHLDHGSSFDLCVKCLKYGFTSIMYDGSLLPLEENAIRTNEIIKTCHAYGVPVEAEIGRLTQLNSGQLDSSGNSAVSFSEIQQYLSLCEPDFLAVGIGNAHGFYKTKPNIKVNILKKYKEDYNIPLVLHGCTDMDVATVKKAISYGVAKINFGTIIRYKYLDLFKKGYDEIDHQGHSFKISHYASKELEKVIESIIDLSGSVGKA